MSLQECHCGWAEEGTYEDLRNHQEEEGCEATAASDSDKIFRKCHCGWSKVTTYHGLRVHQGKMGCTKKGEGLQKAEVVRPWQKDWRDPKSSEVRQDRIRDDVKYEIQMREPKVAQARSSVKANEGTSEAELPELTSVFSDVSIAEDGSQHSIDCPITFSFLQISNFAVDVELDPTTAYECLVSADGKRLSNRAGTQGARRRFGSILGRNRLTSGKSYWEVEVGNQTGWSLGVATGDAQCKGGILLCPENGYWVAQHYENKFAALTNPEVGLPLKEKPQKVGVFLDYEEGLVSFYDVTAQSLIYSFTECSFTEGIYPYFLLHLKEDGSADPLIIATVKRQ